MNYDVMLLVGCLKGFCCFECRWMSHRQVHSNDELVATLHRQVFYQHPLNYLMIMRKKHIKYSLNDAFHQDVIECSCMSLEES